MKSLKRMHPLILAAIIFGLALGAGIALAKPGRATGGGQASPTGQSTCAECHEDTAKAFARNPHSALGDSACASCHSGADKHLAEGGGTNIFAFKTAEPSIAKTKKCLTCHDDDQAHYMAGPHGKASLDCTACHSAHGQPVKPALLKAGETKTCAACHSEVMAKFSLNERHRLQEGILECSSCHDPHAPDATGSLGGFKQEACLKCHTDKGGPFLHEHGASRVEGCTICHDPHGSPNRYMLTHQSPGDLCFSCHVFTVQWHKSFDAKTTNCTACHTTIHGSNLSRIFLK